MPRKGKTPTPWQLLERLSNICLWLSPLYLARLRAERATIARALEDWQPDDQDGRTAKEMAARTLAADAGDPAAAAAAERLLASLNLDIHATAQEAPDAGALAGRG